MTRERRPTRRAEPVDGDAVFSVAICTRNRPLQLGRTLTALLEQPAARFPIVVVDQSDSPDPSAERAAAMSDRVTVIDDAGRGLSRARNIAWRHVRSEWVVFVDDDCIVEGDWAATLDEELRAHPGVAFVSGHVEATGSPGGGYRPVTTYPVTRPRLRSGRWLPPYRIGFGVCMAVRRDAIAALGGWDERLGPGVPDFPAADDMDFNYRLLRAGAVAYATPRVRAGHEQWRAPEDVPPLWYGYMAAWAGFSVKHLKTGDVLGGMWLWTLGLSDTARVFVGALRRRSRAGFTIGIARLRGYVVGTRKAIARRW